VCFITLAVNFRYKIKYYFGEKLRHSNKLESSNLKWKDCTEITTLKMLISKKNSVLLTIT